MPTASFDCGCDQFPSGAADQYKVTLAGIASGSCGQCTSLNGDYILSRDASPGSCFWSLTLGATVCGVTKVVMKFFTTTSGRVDVEFSGTGSNFVFQKQGVTSGLEDSYALTLTIGPTCNYSSATCTIVPLAFTRDSTNAAKWNCLPTMQGGWRRLARR